MDLEITFLVFKNMFTSMEYGYKKEQRKGNICERMAVRPLPSSHQIKYQLEEGCDFDFDEIFYVKKRVFCGCHLKSDIYIPIHNLLGPFR
jgi:hypothetical protein